MPYGVNTSPCESTKVKQFAFVDRLSPVGFEYDFQTAFVRLTPPSLAAIPNSVYSLFIRIQYKRECIKKGRPEGDLWR